MRVPAILAPAITRAPNTAAQLTMVVRVITAARALTMAITHITVARATTMAVDPLTRTTATTRAGRIPIGVTERPGDITLTRTGAVIRTAHTITTRTTRQLTAITPHWLPPCSGALANSVIITA